MKKLGCLFIVMSFLFSCSKYGEYYDIEAPQLNFAACTGEQILFQFNEPVKEFKCKLNLCGVEKETGGTNDFPVSNIYVDKEFFLNKEILLKKKSSIQTGNDLTIEVKDNKENMDILKVSVPVINENPVELSISDIQLKYSEKKPQNFVIKAIKGGNILGFSINFYINNDLCELVFDEEFIKAGTSLKLVILPDKTNYKTGGNIKFSSGLIKINTKMRISPSGSLICIKKQDCEITDYILFYDSKSHPIEYYQKKKSYRQMIYFLKTFDIEPVYIDIKGNTVRKHIVKYKNRFMINTNG